MRNSFPAAPEPLFEIAADWPDEATLLVHVRGSLDQYSVPETKQLFLEQLTRRPAETIVDLSDASVNSCGIGLLIHLAQRLRSDRRGLRVVCGQQLEQLLRVNGVEDRVPRAARVEKALGRRWETTRGRRQTPVRGRSRDRSLQRVA